jgi:hypothetical protein
MNKLDGHSIAALIVVALLAGSAYVFHSEVMKYVRVVLEAGHLRTGIVLVVFVIVATHSIKVKTRSENGVFVIKSGFIPLDVFLTFVTYSAVATTACSLLEGAVIQQFFGDATYFTKFDQLDIYVLLGVASLLLWYVILHMYILARELFFKDSPYEVSTEERHNKVRPREALARFTGRLSASVSPHTNNIMET